MSEARIGELEEQIRQEEKRFLMERYISMLLLQIKPSDGDADDAPLDDQTVESLQVARAYVASPLGEKIDEMLAAEGHQADELEEEDSSESEYGGEADGVDGVDEQDASDGLFDDEGDAIVETDGSDPDEADVDGESAHGSADGLFEDEDLVGDGQPVGGDGDSADDGELESLFDDAEEADAEGDLDAIAAEGDTEGMFDDDDDDDVGLFDEETTSASDNGASK